MAIPVLGGGYAPLGSGGQYGWVVDPSQYAAGFTDLAAPWNAQQLGLIQSAYGQNLQGLQGTMAGGLGQLGGMYNQGLAGLQGYMGGGLGALGGAYTGGLAGLGQTGAAGLGSAQGLYGQNLSGLLGAAQQGQAGLGGITSQGLGALSGLYGQLQGGLSGAYGGGLQGMREAQGLVQNYLGQMPTGIEAAGINQFVGNLTGGQQAWDQSLLGRATNQYGQLGNSTIDQFISRMPQIQGLVQGATSPLESGLRESLRRMTGEVSADIGSQMAGLGSLYSTATGDAIAKRMGEATQNAFTQLAQTQAGLTGQLGSQALSSILGGNTAGAQLGLQGLTTGLGAAQGLASQNLAAQQASAQLGAQSGLGFLSPYASLAQTGLSQAGGLGQSQLGNIAGLYGQYGAGYGGQNQALLGTLGNLAAIGAGQQGDVYQGLLGQYGGLAQTGLGQLGGLYGTGVGALAGLAGGAQSQLGGLYQSGLGAYGGLAQNALGQYTNLRPEFVAPDIAAQPTWWQSVGQPIFGGLLGAGTQLGTAAILRRPTGG